MPRFIDLVITASVSFPCAKITSGPCHPWCTVTDKPSAFRFLHPVLDPCLVVLKFTFVDRLSDLVISYLQVPYPEPVTVPTDWVQHAAGLPPTTASSAAAPYHTTSLEAHPQISILNSKYSLIETFVNALILRFDRLPSFHFHHSDCNSDSL